MLKLVVFDFDGVIADSESAHFGTIQEVIREEGLAVDWDTYLERYLGYDDEDCLTALLRDNGQEAGVERVAELVERKSKRYAQRVRGESIVFAGVERLLGELKGEGIFSAICSGALRGEIEMILEGAGLKDHFLTIVAAEDVEAGKPDPEGYRRAVELVNGMGLTDKAIEVGQCAAIEDSMWGIRAAQGAGLRCMGVASSYPAAELGMADDVVETIEQVTVGRLAAMLNGQVGW